MYSEYIILGLVSGLCGLLFMGVILPLIIKLFKNNKKVTKFLEYSMFKLYCSAIISAIIITTIEFSCWGNLPSWQYILLAYLTTIAIAYLVAELFIIIVNNGERD